MSLTIGQHEALRNNLFKVLADLVKIMTYNDMDYLFIDIQKLELEEIDKETMNMIKSMGENRLL